VILCADIGNSHTVLGLVEDGKVVDHWRVSTLESRTADEWGVLLRGLLRGSVVGAASGFAGGLVVDLLTLDTLGITSLVLTLAGFWAGRYGETTARGRRVAPLVAVGVITVLAALFSVVLHYMLGDEVDARQALVSSLAPELVLNLLLALPVYALLRAIVRGRSALEPTGEVELVV